VVLELTVEMAATLVLLLEQPLRQRVVGVALLHKLALEMLVVLEVAQLIAGLLVLERLGKGLMVE
jgi:hypothetical protein